MTNDCDQRARKVGIPLPQNAQAVLRLHRIVLSPCQQRTARHLKTVAVVIVSPPIAVQQSFAPFLLTHDATTRSMRGDLLSAQYPSDRAV